MAAKKTPKTPDKRFEFKKTEDGNVRLVINTMSLLLTPTEIERISLCLNTTVNSPLTFPIESHGTFILYDNNIVAASLSFSKVANNGYVVFATHRTPKMKTLKTDMFFISEDVMKVYLEICKVD